MDRFWLRVEKTDTCWLWTGSKSRDGFGLFYSDGKTRPARRVSFEHAHGSIDPARKLWSSCWKNGCVNPDHLFYEPRRTPIFDREEQMYHARSGPVTVRRIADESRSDAVLHG